MNLFLNEIRLSEKKKKNTLSFSNMRENHGFQKFFSSNPFPNLKKLLLPIEGSDQKTLITQHINSMDLNPGDSFNFAPVLSYFLSDYHSFDPDTEHILFKFGWRLNVPLIGFLSSNICSEEKSIQKLAQKIEFDLTLSVFLYFVTGQIVQNGTGETLEYAMLVLQEAFEKMNSSQETINCCKNFQNIRNQLFYKYGAEKLGKSKFFKQLEYENPLPEDMVSRKLQNLAFF